MAPFDLDVCNDIFEFHVCCCFWSPILFPPTFIIPFFTFSMLYLYLIFVTLLEIITIIFCMQFHLHSSNHTSVGYGLGSSCSPRLDSSNCHYFQFCNKLSTTTASSTTYCVFVRKFEGFSMHVKPALMKQCGTFGYPEAPEMSS